MRRVQHEADISASQHAQEDDARIQKAHEHEERTSCSEKEESEREKTPERLNAKAGSACNRGD